MSRVRAAGFGQGDGPPTPSRYRPPRPPFRTRTTSASGSMGQSPPDLKTTFRPLRPVGFLRSPRPTRQRVRLPAAQRAPGCPGAVPSPPFHPQTVSRLPRIYSRTPAESDRAAEAGGQAAAVYRRGQRQTLPPPGRERRPHPGPALHPSSPPPENPSASFPRSAVTAGAASAGTAFRTPKTSIPLGKTAPDLASGPRCPAAAGDTSELPRGPKRPLHAPGAAHARPRSAASRAPRAPLRPAPAAPRREGRAGGQQPCPLPSAHLPYH
ncbi:vegetative cell wall protein gp1-like [Camarhynchus parvulus]|uniref:vegetative cell wall protein gp1-like n=1 Tax=Geospiza parvula TaxID=87175 RepID=UPI00123820B6|nr:vegetative cell wall protein gp1-like [Camarhynchus parvulus]